jgi:DNA-binding SARP family transcriptional activator/TolB-like protein
MIELRLLGPQSIRRADGREFGKLPAQPKRFALLAFLALENGSLQRRDAIAAMFWGDSDQQAARRALRNTLFNLREALGDGVIATQGDELLGVDPSMITTDVARLREAFAAGRFEEAADLYRGELLLGIHFPNAGDAFEEWLSAQRRASLDTVIAAMCALADRDAAANDAGKAAYWAARASALVPGDEVLLRHAMLTLDASGDRGGALRKHEEYSKRLAAEYRASPNAETEELAKRIRDGVTSTKKVERPRSATAISAPTTAADEPIATPLEDTERTLAPALPRASRYRAPRSYGIVAFALLLVCGIAWVLVQRHDSARATRPRVLVSVFDNLTGDSSLQSIGRMTQDWLTQGLMRTNMVDVVDERVAMMQARSGSTDAVAMARRSGAGMLVSGSYYRSGDSLLLQAAVVNTTTGRVVRVIGPVVTSTARPVAAIDLLRSRVMTALASAVDAHVSDEFEHLGQIPTFEAYEAYVQGLDAFWHGDGRAAEVLYVKAAHLDTTFTAAAAAAANAAGNYHDCALVDSLKRALEIPARELTRIDRLSIEIADARCSGRNLEMLRLTLERADLEPRTSILQFSAATAALWANRPARALDILDRLNPETDLGWSTDSTHFAYWSGLTEALHMLGRHEEELAAASRAPAFAPLDRAWMRARALSALARPVELLTLVDTILTYPAETANDIGLGPYTNGRPAYTATAGWVTVWIARELMAHGDPATARKVAARSYAWYRSQPARERDTPEERLVASWALDLMGSYDEADRMARALVREDTANIDYRGVLAGSLAAQGDTLAADSLDWWLATRPNVQGEWSAAFYRAHDAVLLHDTADAVARVREALENGAWPMWIHIDPPLATLAPRRDMAQLTAPRG